MKFVYQQRTKEDVETRAKGSGGLYDNYIADGISVFSPKPGDQHIRVLPPTHEGARHYGIDIWIHSNIGPDNQSYLCSEKMGKGTCCICAEKYRAERAGEQDYAKKLAPYKRVVMWIINRKKEEDGPVIYAMPQRLDRDISGISIDKTTGELLLIDHPEKGYDVTFVREGANEHTKYVSAAIARRSSPLTDDDKKFEAWLDYVQKHPLPSILKFYDQDHILKVFNGKAPEKGEERPAASGPETRVETRRPRIEDAPPAAATTPAPSGRATINDPKESLDGDNEVPFEGGRVATAPPAASAPASAPAAPPAEGGGGGLRASIRARLGGKS